MPFAVALLAIDVLFIVHAARTGRLWPWTCVIVGLPGLGALAYAVMELVPYWLAACRARRVRRQISRALDAERRYRALHEQLAGSDTVAIRAALARECCRLELFGEARRHCRDILARPHGQQATFMIIQAQAEFGMGLYGDVLATLDALKARWPAYESSEGHLLYARALDESGRDCEALVEYDELARYHAGAEPRVRHALLLRRLGRREEAEARLAGLIAEFHRAPKFVRRAQAEWLGLAVAAVRR
jgi:hypothetical protein